MIDRERLMNERDIWPKVNIEMLDETNREIFLKRFNAINAYIEAEKSLNKIYLETSVPKSEIFRLLKRCQKIDEFGNVYGYRGLLRYQRIKPYQVKSDKKINGYNNEKFKKSGAFKYLLDEFPVIKETIDNLVFNKKNGEIRANNRTKDIHKKFIQVCKSVGLNTENGKYPFNTIDLAKRSLYRYLRKIKNTNPSKVIRNYGKDSVMLYNNTGQGDKNTIIERPYERVEFDGHKIDVTIAISYISPEGDEVVDIIHRIWLLAVIDVATNLILGYHICYNQEYSTDDVMLCIRKSILPWSPKQLTIPALRLPKEGGFASEIIPATRYAVWDEICFDNAKAHLAKSVKPKLKKIVGCSINTGPVGTPTRRPKIEKLFDLLEEEGFHRLTNTTGSNTSDVRREDSEKKAIKYRVSVDEIEQLAEILIATRNGIPQRSLNNLSPLDVMQQRINRNFVFRTLNEEYREGKEFMMYQETRIIRGSLEKGRRPYIRFEGVDYRNYVLSENFNLIGTKITLEIDSEDLRNIRAFLPGGGELGILKAQGKWSIKKHSLRIRKAINKLNYRKVLHFLNEDDPIEIYHNYLKTKAKTNRTKRNELVHLDSIINKPEDVPGDTVERTVEKKVAKPIKKPKNEKLQLKTIQKEKKNRVVKDRFFFNS
ncbi:hypothetical protein PGC35_19405 [Psychrobacillus sp. PGGUH221]|uniref:hypothetical protein n=1 Tax=Psychrobacillus sp. PGGUH221 TaxID=3020058 RepID=UPI0035C7590C